MRAKTDTPVMELRRPKGPPELHVRAGGTLSENQILLWAQGYARAVLRIHRGDVALPAPTEHAA